MPVVSEKSSNEVKTKLERINSSGSNGKSLLKTFLDRELKEKLLTKTSAKNIMDASQSLDSNVYQFAALLDSSDENIKKFKDAGKLLAESLDHRCLFYDLVYQKSLMRGDWLSSKSKIKTFLTSTASKIVDKLKSDELLSILEVFIALVMWNFILIREEGSKDKSIPEPIGAETQKPERKYSREEQELEQWLYNKDSMGNFMPLPSDIVQGDMNNCYMLGVLISLARRDPKFIKDKLIKIEGDKVIVSLHDYTVRKIEENEVTKRIYKPAGMHEYKLSKAEIKEGDWAKHKARWVYAVEIALAKLLRDDHAGKAFFEPSASIKSVLSETAEPSMATTILTGKEAKFTVFPEFWGREQSKLLKKFPDSAKYNDYCIKIRDRILKHLAESGDTSGLIVAAFDKISDSNPFYKLFKAKPELLSKCYKVLNTEHMSTARECIKIINGEQSFVESGIFRNIASTIYSFIRKHINEPEFEHAKELLQKGGIQSPETDWWLGWFRDDHPDFALKTYDVWYPKWRQKSDTLGDEEAEMSIALCDQFVELMNNKIPFAESKFFDLYLRDVIAPHLAESSKLGGPITEELRQKKMGMVSLHAYAVLDCFEDEETKYWYVTLQNTWGKVTRIDYKKSKHLKTLTFPPNPDSEENNVFNMELAHFCKYLRGLSYDKV